VLDLYQKFQIVFTKKLYENSIIKISNLSNFRTLNYCFYINN